MQILGLVLVTLNLQLWLLYLRPLLCFHVHVLRYNGSVMFSW